MASSSSSSFISPQLSATLFPHSHLPANKVPEIDIPKERPHSPCPTKSHCQIRPFEHAAHCLTHRSKERTGDRARITPGLNERVALNIQQILQVAIAP